MTVAGVLLGIGEALQTVLVVASAAVLLTLLIWWLRVQHPEQGSSHLDDVAGEWEGPPRQQRSGPAEAGAEAMNPKSPGESRLDP